MADFRTNGIYYRDDQYFYVSMDDFKLGDYIGKVNSDSQDNRFRIGATGQLDGVYNVNKGYAQFEIVEVLHKNSDYCIVKENLDYSVALYDNIAFNSVLCFRGMKSFINDNGDDTMIKDNVAEVEANIQKACERAGRSRDEVTLIAVSKTKPVSDIYEVMETGIKDYGENKVQELCDKIETISGSL